MPDMTPSYAYRQKLDGSPDSICLNCLATIPPTKPEFESPNDEHVCHSFLTKSTN
jgi:hypothetical protein